MTKHRDTKWTQVMLRLLAPSAEIAVEKSTTLRYDARVVRLYLGSSPARLIALVAKLSEACITTPQHYKNKTSSNICHINVVQNAKVLDDKYSAWNSVVRITYKIVRYGFSNVLLDLLLFDVITADLWLRLFSSCANTANFQQKNEIATQKFPVIVLPKGFLNPAELWATLRDA